MRTFKKVIGKREIVIIIILISAISLTFGIIIGNKLISKEVLVNEESEEKISFGVRENKMFLAAIDNNGKGVTADLITQIRPGSGLILVNINDVLADLETQYSARLAAQVASNYTNIDLKGWDISFNIKANASVVGGPSAGSAMAVATAAALQDKVLRNDVMITGAILENGDIGEASALVEKAKAAKERNATLFLVAPGLGTEVSEYRKEESCGIYNGVEYCEIDYEAEKVSIGKDIAINVKEVKNLGEALEYFYE